MTDRAAHDGVFELSGVIRPYDWGSTTAIQQMLGVTPDGRRAAELWFGAHAGAPSPALGTTLDKVIAADPHRLLGSAAAAEFDDQLPFLIKVLAADTALSMQVHPNLEQARAGFAAEQRDHVPPDRRNYADANHKPELLCALTPFEALCGFRPADETLALLDDIAVPELDFVADALRGPDGIRAAFTALLEHDDRAAVADAVAARATPDGPLRAAYLTAGDFPHDVGVALSVLLNYVRLEPGQAIYLGAGNVHAYLRGVGVEIMANSDNVLRCGLTSKRIDVAELLRIADFTELREPRWPATDDTFRVPVPDFALRRIGSGPTDLPAGGPRIVLCTDGTADVGGRVIRAGSAAFVPAGATVTVRGGTVFVAQPGQLVPGR